MNTQLFHPIVKLLLIQFSQAAVPHASLCLLYDIYIWKIISYPYPISIVSIQSQVLGLQQVYDPRGVVWFLAVHSDRPYWGACPGSFTLRSTVMSHGRYSATHWSHCFVISTISIQQNTNQYINLRVYSNQNNYISYMDVHHKSRSENMFVGHHPKVCLVIGPPPKSLLGDWALSLFNEPCNWRKDFPKLPHPKTTNYETMIFGEVVAVGYSSRNNPK